MINILITGCQGFIGSHLVEYYAQFPQSFTLYGLDIKSPQSKLTCNPRLNLTHVPEGDSDAYSNAVTEILSTCNIHRVLHLGAETHVDRGFDQSQLFIQRNISYTDILIKACIAPYGSPSFLLFSTDEVFGDTSEPQSVNSVRHPNNLYSMTKSSQEDLVNVYKRAYPNFKPVITRCSNVYGEGQHPEKLIPKLLHCVQHDIPFPIYDNGRSVRQWVYVKDVCKHVDYAITNSLSPYHIASDEVLSVANIVDKVSSEAKKYGKRLRVVDGYRPGHDISYRLEYSFNTIKDTSNLRVFKFIENSFRLLFS